jgi:hypothetical protein
VPDVGSVWFGTGRVVTEADRRRRADERRPGVADALGDAACVARVDLEVLGGERLGDHDRVVEVVDERDRPLPGERRLDTLAVVGPLDLALERRLDGVDGRRIGRDQQRRRELVVLGLRDEVGGEHHRVGGVVGDDADLGRPGVPVGADATLSGEELLRERDVEVARSDDDVAARHARRAVRHRSDGLRTADPHDAVDAEQPGGGEDGAVRPAVGRTVGTDAGRRGAEHDLVDPGDLRGDDRHDDGRRVDGLPARHVHAGTADRPVPHAHAGTVALVLPVLRPGPLVEPADLVGGTLDRPAQRRVEPGEGASSTSSGTMRPPSTSTPSKRRVSDDERVVTVARDGASVSTTPARACSRSTRGRGIRSRGSLRSPRRSRTRRRDMAAPEVTADDRGGPDGRHRIPPTRRLPVLTPVPAGHPARRQTGMSSSGAASVRTATSSTASGPKVALSSPKSPGRRSTRKRSPSRKRCAPPSAVATSTATGAAPGCPASTPSSRAIASGVSCPAAKRITSG